MKIWTLNGAEHMRLKTLTLTVISFLCGWSANAQILPTSDSTINLDNKTSFKLTETEVSSNRDWAFMWHWLNAPAHQEYKDLMLIKFKKYTYKYSKIILYKKS